MNGKRRNLAIVLCGGSGERFGSTLPKQFLSFGGKPLCYYPLAALNDHEDIDEIYVVCKADSMDLMHNILTSFGIEKCREIIEGGASRQESVYAGLTRLEELGADEFDLVLIQDGDRPNLTRRLIHEGLKRAEETGASVTAIESSDSIFLSKLGYDVDSYVPRDTVYKVQTPQTFRFPLIYKAHKKFDGREEPFTDDASMVVAMWGKVAIVDGDEENFKINTQEDGNKFEEYLRRKRK